MSGALDRLRALVSSGVARPRALAAPSAQVTAPRVAAEALRKLAERAQQRSPPAARPRPLTLRDVVAKPPPERPLFVVSDGIGVDSTAMLVGLWRLGFRPDVILHADTGDEHPATVAYREERRAWLRRVGFPDLTIVRRAPSRSKKSGLAFSTLGEKCIANATLPSLAFGGKACSVEWKIKPQEQWLKRFAPAQATWARGRNVVPRAL